MESRRIWNAATTIAAIVAAGVIALAAVGLDTARGQDGAAVNLSGAWKIDRAASDKPQGGRHGGPPPGVEHGKRDRDKRDGDKRGHDGRRHGKLGAYLQIDQNAGGMMVADSSGALRREIVFGETPKSKDADGAPVMTGTWKGSQLEVVAAGRDGKKHVELWQVGDGGRTLTITVRREARGDKPAGEMKRVYRRATA